MAVVSLLALRPSARYAFSKTAVDERAAIRRPNRVSVRLPTCVPRDVLEPPLPTTARPVTTRMLMSTIVNTKRVRPPPNTRSVARVPRPSRVPVTPLETATVSYVLPRVLTRHVIGVRRTLSLTPVPRVRVCVIFAARVRVSVSADPAVCAAPARNPVGTIFRQTALF